MIRRICQHRRPSRWSKELHDIVRGASGGFLFGIPLLYTMEVWWIGSYTEPPLLLCILVVSYVVVFLLNRVEGFRQKQSNQLLDMTIESVEALAIGIISAAFTMILLRRITLDTSLQEALGKLIFESVPFSLGVAMSRSFLSGEPDKEQQSKNHRRSTKNNQSKQKGNGLRNSIKATTERLKDNVGFRDTLSDISATLIGAIIVGFSIAPTDEINELAAGSSPPWLLAIIAASLLISYLIVFAAGLTNQQKRRQQQGIFQSPESETVISYLISLLASVLMLWFFQKLSLSDPWFLWLRYTLILGLPTTIGGAAGRLAV
ncbi:MAG: TIGR02587 family membrane protein [Coleofasciculaceae cyanobacterium]